MVKSVVALPTCALRILTASGASFDIDNTLYLAVSGINVELSCSFLSSKKVSSVILFLSAEGKDNQTLPSSGR